MAVRVHRAGTDALVHLRLQRRVRRQCPGTLTTGDQSGSTGIERGPRSSKSPAA
jgi:hypothetical protein